MRPPKHPRHPLVAEPVRISVRAKPRARRSQILRVEGLRADIALAAPPADGAANAELLVLLSTTLSVPKSALRLVIGDSSKQKVVAVNGLSAEEVMQRLLQAAAAEPRR